jgi:hypothetical protein
MAARLAEIQRPRARRAHARTKDKQEAGSNSSVRQIVAGVTELLPLEAEETVSETTAFPAAVRLVALAPLGAAQGGAAETVPEQAVRAVLPAWAEAAAVREAVALEAGAADVGGK